jgi:phage terminase large subunit
LVSAVQKIEVPEILVIPPKLNPLIRRFNDYKIFIIEGGRGSAKTQSVARILLNVAEEREVRIFCGREIQSTIEESVHAVLGDLIMNHDLAFKVRKNGISSYLSGSTFKFKGFREQGSVNIKGIEGADIVWVDEAQALTKPTLDVLLPTLRKDNCKYIFTLNRLFRDDAVMDLSEREDCLHIHIDYFENPFCPATLLDEAERCRITNEREYNHIWLGQPASSGDDYLMDFDKLYASLATQPHGDLFKSQRVMGIDIGAQGNDASVACILDRMSAQHWENTEQIKWYQPDTTLTVGKIIGLIAQFKPDVIALDVGGVGWGVYCNLIAAGVQNLYAFNGAETKGIGPMSYNVRADAYWITRDWFGLGFIRMREQYRDTLKQLEKIKMKMRADGKRQIEAKEKMKAEIGHSPDEADSLVIAIYAAVKYLGKSATSQAATNSIIRKTVLKRR